MTSAKLLKKRWCARTLLVTCDDQAYTVQYSPWGVNTEKVSVDGVVVVRRRDSWSMNHGFRFWVGDQMAALRVSIPPWVLLPFLGDLSFVCLEVGGEVVYEEGRAPDNPLQWTVARGGFPVVDAALNRAHPPNESALHRGGDVDQEVLPR